MKKNRMIAWILILLLIAGVVIPTLLQFGLNLTGAVYADSADKLQVSFVGGSVLKNNSSEENLVFQVKNFSDKDYQNVRLRIVSADVSSIILADSEEFSISKKSGSNIQSTRVQVPVNTLNLTHATDYIFSVRLIAPSSGSNVSSGKDSNENPYFYYNDVDFSGTQTGDSALGRYSFTVLDSDTPIDKPQEKQYIPNMKLSISIPQNGLEAGHVNTVRVKGKNRGNSILSEMKLGISGLPEGVSLSNQAVKQEVDSIRIGDEKSAEFRLFIKDTVKSGNYPISITGEGKLPNQTSFSTEEVVYLNIKGEEKEDKTGTLVIRNVSAPNNAKAGADFTLNFEVANVGSSEVKNIKVSTEATEGVVNKTRGIFVEENISSGQSKKYSVTFFSSTKTEPKNYPIKIMVEQVAAKEGEDPFVPSSQYAGVYIFGGGEKKEDEEKSDGVKNPQIMVESYDFGGIDVKAGEEFVLELTLANTSQKTLRNIKVSLSADNGIFVPVNTSNSFFINAMAPNQRIVKRIRFATKPSAEQQTFGINVDMTYEDVKGNALTAKDIISVPVVQKTKLNVGEVNIPHEGIFANQPSPLSVTFYNMGKTVLSNLFVTAKGDFELEDKNGYFVGNMETGKSDSYDFSIIAEQPGEAKGTLTFTFEDVSGNIQTLTKDFVVTVNEMTPMEEGPEEPVEPPKDNRWKIGGGIGALLFLIIAVVWLKKKHKRKKEKELTIDE
ncbi:MAG: hypothetical protein Q3993_04780 [Filifactor alocis]|nr:hypothetical protein [Filifactor alocis]